jgi:hypothetical protein
MSDTTQTQTQGSKKRRKVGGQPGNQNALRHGFYASKLGEIPLSELDEGEMRNLLGEVAMIKDIMFRIYQKADNCVEYSDLLEILRGLSVGGISLSRLLQTHSRVSFISDAGITYKELTSSLNFMTRHAANLVLADSYRIVPAVNETLTQKMIDEILAEDAQLCSEREQYERSHS